MDSFDLLVYYSIGFIALACLAFVVEVVRGRSKKKRSYDIVEIELT